MAYGYLEGSLQYILSELEHEVYIFYTCKQIMWLKWFRGFNLTESIAEPTESRRELIQGEVSVAIGIQGVKNIL